MTAESAPGRAADPAAASPVPTVFFGSGAFALPILDVVATHPRLHLVAVVTAPDRPAGRTRALAATPVAARARELGLPLLQPARVRAPDAVAEIAALAPGLGVLADFGQIVPQALLELPRHGILGVHPSLLPAHRGATPIPATIAAGGGQAGITIYRMDAGIDTGPLLASTSWELSGRETAPELEADAARRGADLLRSTIAAYLDGEVQPTPQPAAQEPPTRPLQREDGRLDPNLPASALERLVRAYLGWPGTFVETAAGRVVVTRASVARSQPGDAPGRLVRHDDGVAITTVAARLVLEAVHPAGGRAMSGREYVRGRPHVVDAPVLPPSRVTG